MEFALFDPQAGIMLGMAIGALLSGLLVRTMGFVEVVVAMLAAILISGIFSVLIGAFAVFMIPSLYEAAVAFMFAGVLGGAGGGLLGSFIARINYYVGPLNQYAVFSGRATRKEYWLFFFLSIIIYILLSFSEGFLEGFLQLDFVGPYGPPVPVLSFVYIIALLTPSLAVGVRRIHDAGKSAWWLLAGLIPILGAVSLAILLMNPSESGRNKYGPDSHQEPNIRRRLRPRRLRRTIRE